MGVTLKGEKMLSYIYIEHQDLGRLADVEVKAANREGIGEWSNKHCL